MSVSLVLGDLHIGKGLSIAKPGIGTSLNSRIADQINILNWVFDTACSKEVENIILTGDIFEDPKPHPTLIALFLGWLKKCSNQNIQVHIIVGNHDIIRSGQLYITALDIIAEAELENIFIYNNFSTIHTNGASFTFMPFRDRRSFNTNSNEEALKLLKSKMPYELAEIERSQKKIVIGHFAIEGSIYVGDEIDDMMNEIFCPLDMFAGYDYVFMGHVHKPQVLCKSPRIAHIGSMDISDFSEANHKKIIAILDTSKDNFIEEIVIPTRELINITIEVPEKVINPTDFILEEIKNIKNLNKAMVKITATINNVDSQNVDRSAVEEALYSAGAFYVSRFSEERKIAPIKRNSSSQFIDKADEVAAVKLYAELNIEEEYRQDFIKLSLEIVKEYAANKTTDL
jgi:exonuclease SbcD